MNDDVHDRVDQAERTLSHQFPADYRHFLATENGFDGRLGEVWISLWDVATVVEAPSWVEGTGYYEDHPGLLLIGSDGAGERIGFDMRQDPPSVVLVNISSAGWDEACWQAGSFTEFMARIRAGENFRFEQANGQ